MTFSETITDWYRQNKRDLPWRKTTDPYKIWLSEIMLQQTRVEQGLPYYKEFVRVFPTVHDLAEATEEKVLKMWQGLGYYSRARNLHYTAKHIAFENNGKFPDSYKSLLKLKGVGDYTASAIASIAFKEASPVVDGNVYRVLARYFGIDTPINSSRGIRYFKELAHELIDKTDPATYNQGIMEFGAIQCKPKSPVCGECPLNTSCVALKDQLVDKLPVKIRNTKIRHRYFNYLIIEDKDHTVLFQRKEKDIWQHLYEFPLIETEAPMTEDMVTTHPKFRKLIGDSRFQISLYNKDHIVHKLSHQHIFASFWVVSPRDGISDGILKSEIKAYPVPVLIANFVQEYEF